MKKMNLVKRISIVMMVMALPTLGLLFAQVGGSGSAGDDSQEQVDTTGMPQTKQEKLDHFIQLRATCVQQGNTAAVAYCDWAIGYLNK